MVYEVFGVASSDAKARVTLTEGQGSAKIEVGHSEARLGAASCRLLARRLYQMAHKLEKAAEEKGE